MNRFMFGLIFLLALPASAGVVEGLSYFDNQQYPQAFAEFKPLADQGNAVAQYYTAYLYLNGYGITQNEDLGIRYLEASADQGNERAMSMLGYFLSEGIHTPQDKERAIQLYEKAAEAGDDDALTNLGVLYYLGDSVERNRDTALSYFKRVNLMDKPIVGRYIGDIYQFSENEEERQKARTYYEIAAADGDLSSFHMLGYLDQIGFEGEKNLERSLKYYTYAASQNYPPSQYALGGMYVRGDSVPRSITTAYAWFSLSAAQGLPDAVETQKRLEESMTLSELDRARRELVEIQRTVLGQVPAPIQKRDAVAAFSSAVTTAEKPIARPSSSRRRRRR